MVGVLGLTCEFFEFTCHTNLFITALSSMRDKGSHPRALGVRDMLVLEICNVHHPYSFIFAPDGD